MDLALKSERIAELSGKLNGFADRGSAENLISDFWILEIPSLYVGIFPTVFKMSHFSFQKY